MDGHIYKIVELVGSSADSIEGAIQGAIARATESIHNLRWFEVLETRGQIEDGSIACYQVRIKVGFRVGSADFSVDDIPEPGTDPFHEGP